MLWFILFIIGCLWIAILYYKEKKREKERDVTVLVAITLVYAFFLFIATIVSSCDCVDYNETFTKLQDDLIILQKRYVNQKELIISYSAKYPIEKELFESLNPKILLSVPEIKSDNLLVANIDKLLKIEDAIYDKELEINGIKKNIRIFRKYRFFIPTIFAPIKIDS